MGTIVQRRLAITAAAGFAMTVGISLADDKVNRQFPRPLEGHTATSLTTAMSSLKSAGVVIVPNILDENMLQKIQATQVFKSMPRETIHRPPSKATRRRGPPGARRGLNEGDDERDLWPPSAQGRYHRREDSFEESDMRVFEELERKILPLVFEFFDAETDDGKEDEEGFFRSEMQVCELWYRTHRA